MHATQIENKVYIDIFAFIIAITTLEIIPDKYKD